MCTDVPVWCSGVLWAGESRSACRGDGALASRLSLACRDTAAWCGCVELVGAATLPWVLGSDLDVLIDLTVPGSFFIFARRHIYRWYVPCRSLVVGSSSFSFLLTACMLPCFSFCSLSSLWRTRRPQGVVSKPCSAGCCTSSGAQLLSVQLHQVTGCRETTIESETAAGSHGCVVLLPRAQLMFDAGDRGNCRCQKGGTKTVQCSGW